MNTISTRFRDFAFPAVVITPDLQILDVSESFTVQYGWARNLLAIADPGSQSKIAKFLPTLLSNHPLEVSLQKKNGEIDFVDLYVVWSRGEGVVSVVQKSTQYALVSSKLSQLQAELSIRNVELSEEKDRAEVLLGEMNLRTAPAITLRPGLSLIPIFGEIDSTHMQQIFSRLLNHFVEEQTEKAILDFTAATDFSFSSWEGVDQFVRSANIMGIEIIVTGLHPKQVKALQDLEIRSGHTQFFAKLASALKELYK